MTNHRGLDHKGVMQDCVQEIHFCALHWRTLVIDPPWTFRQRWQAKGAKGKKIRGAASHYATRTLGELLRLPVPDWAEEDAHLYLWTTNAFVEEAYRLVRAWGFAPKTLITWEKPGLGMGSYFRNNTEHAIFAVRGRLPLLRKDLKTTIHAPRRKHSEKPQAFYDMVEEASPGPRVDVFARAQRIGWDVAGNEVYSAIPELAHKEAP